MNKTVIRHVQAQVIDEDMMLTLADLCQSCGAPRTTIETWVVEGVLVPTGKQPRDWRFSGNMLRRARLARQMAEDMEVNASGIALALDLLEQIDALRAQLARTGRHQL
ncbi:chaperone modulatory protein CbpM [Oxalicibacterium flavum]|uniref:Chaperone modulatory protein CbpM n=1 Tax=Oxalicibacterium flavum TaxID=179467 RepID=A0A8J2UK76_9BURK|nr:chaperone modulator CbpM [Oxalicibacterium flavum]GGC02060.1 chaperone modulatory protein CbpM [Oxalicibacterium flavum]